MAFAPIAIVGRACLLPGAHSPEQLWQALSSGRDLLSRTPEGRWLMPMERALCAPAAADADRSWSDRGGYISGFEQIWNPQGFAVPASELEGLDPLFHWLLHSAREALRDAGQPATEACGAVFGHLGFPSVGMARHAQSVWTGEGQVDARNRAMSAGAAELLQRALKLGAGSHAIDAACASALYAIQIACERLHQGTARCMLAGGIQAADDLFLHVGFCALNALSRSGRSRPFHRDADGLVPAEGAAFVVLKRLRDARRDGDHIHGVIRGIGLSNDGRGKGFLAPAEEGQLRAMRSAQAQSGIAASEVSLLECHATGTPVGDATELRSSAAAYAGAEALPIGSLKSNLGHLITAAGAAGLIKVLEAMRHQQRPPSLHADALNEALPGTPFRVLQQLEPWPAESARIAAVSAFGFGGNNAHLLVSEHEPELSDQDQDQDQEQAAEPIAMVGLGVLAGAVEQRAQLAEALFAAISEQTGPTRIEHITLDLAALRFPPLDLQRTLPQQLAMLEVAREALLEARPVSRERAGVYVGMEPDPEVARYGLRWRLAPLADGVVDALNAAAVVGCMPNIPANRLSVQFDLAGPGFTVQGGSASGLIALQLGIDALQRGELDLALIGAVDLCCEPVQQSLRPERGAGDAAVAIVLKRLSQAQADGDRIYALLPAQNDIIFSASDQSPELELSAQADAGAGSGYTDRLQTRFGHCGAASGLLHSAAAALALHHRRLPGGRQWLSSDTRSASIRIEGRALQLSEAPQQPRYSETALPRLRCYSGDDRASLLQALHSGREGGNGPCRLALVCDESGLEQGLLRARQHVSEGLPTGRHIHFREQPLPGDLAFVFTSAGACYPGMGSCLLQHMPQLLNSLAARTRHLATALHWCDDPAASLPDAGAQLWAASALSQLHLHLSRDLLGMQAQAWLGYSSGETNALFASGIWEQPDQLIEASRASGMMEQALGGRFGAVASAWNSREPVQWSNWTVMAPLSDVQAAIAGLPRVHLAIIHSDADVVIAGDAEQCRQAVAVLGEARCQQLGYPLAVHVPELRSVAEAWYQLHHRPSKALAEGQRIYSNAFGAAYQPSAEACARSIHEQAIATLDLRPAILSAWEDGSRIFVEHGPGSTYGRAIRHTLGKREALVVSLDRPGQRLDDLLSSIGALWVAGVPLDLDALQRALPTATRRAAPQRELRLPAHPPPVQLAPDSPARPVASDSDRLPVRPAVVSNVADATRQATAPMRPAAAAALAPKPAQSTVMSHNETASDMPPAPTLASVLFPPEQAPVMPIMAAPAQAKGNAAAKPPASQSPMQPAAEHLAAASAPGALGQLAALMRQVSASHQQHLALQQQVQQQFMSLRQAAMSTLESAAGGAVQSEAHLPSDSPVAMPAPTLELPAAHEAGSSSTQPSEVPTPLHPAIARALGHSSSPAPSESPIASKFLATAPSAPVDAGHSYHPAIARALGLPGSAALGKPATSAADQQSPSKDQPSGPCFSREQLLSHAGGRISDIFGAEFRYQDTFHRQVRMPEPPLLLADRVIGLQGKALELGRGRIWTETDVSADAWYLHHGHMPGGVMIEAGQADLMLISWQGIDRYNRSERVYRLLGCELTYHGDLPRVGDTLRFDIRLDGHARQDDIRLMFFHYECHNGQRLQLSVRGGQAGFFSDQELAESAGCLWQAEDQQIVDDPQLDPPDVECTRSCFDQQALQAFAAGDAAACFGPGFEFAATHTRSPSIHPGRMLLQHRVTEVSSDGGPWQRGYLRAELDIDPQQWFFAGHFKNDPCMPGTLMFEGCLQMMAFYLAWRGYTLRRDGWRFQPVPELPYQLQCRGQVTPQSRRLVTELFVEEVSAGPVPTLYADLLCSVDGLKAFHARRVAVQLVPDWPLEHLVDRSAGNDSLPVASVEGLRLDQRSLLASAMGRPSEAFGPMYRRFDGPQRVARLPSPPYLFASRVREVHGPIGVMRAGARVLMDYDIPADAWYFDDNGCRRMPFAVLLEAALQPCGWLSSYVGSTLHSDNELGFRNLDGEGTLLAELDPDSGTLQTEVTLTDVSASGDMIIESFEVCCRLGEREVYRLRTVFGFFPPEALAAQKGLPAHPGHQQLLQRQADGDVVLDDKPQRPRLGRQRLQMIDRIEGVWPGEDNNTLGSIRTSRAVTPADWFFKAHFFQDPVQPGSLGLEAMVQTLQAWMLLQDMDQGISKPRFQALTLNENHRWRYRGQVLPHHQRLSITMMITASGRDQHGSWARANASLWVDGQRIYEASDFGVRIVSGEDDV